MELTPIREHQHLPDDELVSLLEGDERCLVQLTDGSLIEADGDGATWLRYTASVN